MLYEVHWPSWPSGSNANKKAASSFATWDGVVVDATFAVRWLLGKRIETAINLLGEKYAAQVALVPGSYKIKEVPTWQQM